MKKFAKVFGLLAVVICMGAMLVACGGVTGTYKGGYSDEDSTMSIELTLKLKSGDEFEMSGKMTIGAQSYEETTSGTYKVDGETIKLTIPAEDEDDDDMIITGTIKGGVITIEYMQGISIELKK